MFNHLDTHCNFESFTQVKSAFNDHIENNEFNTNTRRVFEYVLNCSTNHSGVATILRETIARNLELSLATIKRALSELKKAKAINVKPTGRKTQRGGRGANIYLIEPYVEPIDEPLEKHDEPYVDKASDTENQNATTLATKNNLKQSNVNKAHDFGNLVEIFLEFSKFGVSKAMFLKVVDECKARDIKHNAANYLRGTLRKIVDRINANRAETPINPFDIDAIKQFAAKRNKSDESATPKQGKRIFNFVTGGYIYV